MGTGRDGNKPLTGPVGMGTNLCRDGYGWGQTSEMTCRDGNKPLWGRVGMGTNL